MILRSTRFFQIVLERRHIFHVKVASKVDGALVAQWKALEHEDIETSTEDRVFSAGQPAKKLVAQAENNQVLVLGVDLEKG